MKSPELLFMIKQSVVVFMVLLLVCIVLLIIQKLKAFKNLLINFPAKKLAGLWYFEIGFTGFNHPIMASLLRNICQFIP